MKSILPFVLFVALAACTSQKGPLTVHNMEAPPGTMKLSDNFFVDETEITNFNWCEYMYSVELTYGSGSPQYLATLPDTTVLDSISKEYSVYYLRHAVYRNYPVVGVSWDQVMAFTKWRSDKVLEGILAREGLIVFRTVHTPDSVFTIEKYYRGEYQGYQPAKEFKFYPVYTLPTSEEWEKITHYSDSLNIIWLKKYDRKLKDIYERQEVMNWAKEKNGRKAEVMVPVYYWKGYNKRKILWHIKGNVREYGAEKDISYGGSWRDSLSTILETKTYPAKKPDAWTGFRNVCTWKVWE